MRLASLLVLLAAVPASAESDRTPPPAYTGTLADDGARKNAPGCGGFMIWTIVYFDLSKAKLPANPAYKADRVPVAVPCIELTRPQMGKTAGKAGVLVKGNRYTVHLGKYGAGPWGKGAHEAIRIDDAKP
jgi:hypothetical protein